MSPPMSLIDLPSPIIDNILCRLPIADLVGTSALCRDWRHRWKYFPFIDLSRKTNHPGTKPFRIATHILRLHRAPLHLFRAHLGPTRDDFFFCDPATLDFLDAVSRRSASSLRSLDLSGFSKISLSSFADRFRGLAHLRLSYFSLVSSPNASSPFPALRSLHLKGISFQGPRSGVDIAEFIPPCPLLESLTVITFGSSQPPLTSYRCSLYALARDFPRLDHLRLSQATLESLRGSDRASWSFRALKSLHLARVKFSAGLGRDCQLSVAVPACPLLETLIVRGSDGVAVPGEEVNLQCRCDVKTILCDFPRLRQLELSRCDLGCLPESLAVPTLLRTLRFNNVESSGTLAGLIAASPLLETVNNK